MHVFVMEWAAMVRDLAAGLLIAGAIEAWVPDDFWRAFFLEEHPLAAKLIGPLVAVATFVCSISNVPLAVVLWKGGISFGGVIAFIFADLLILNIYRKYYGARMAVFLLVTFFAAMAVAGYVMDFTFGGTGLIPDQPDATIPEEGITWNYTTWLNIVFLLPAANLLARFWRTGGEAVLRMMGGSPEPGEQGHGHAPTRHGHSH
ncbi:permease [Streptomyces sp. NPDC087859]|uniref:permease n=1 Tax=Streptomyces sp. NPDC087859 TaxID=3365812 RepID=UPI00381B2814